MERGRCWSSSIGTTFALSSLRRRLSSRKRHTRHEAGTQSHGSGRGLIAGLPKVEALRLVSGDMGPSAVHRKSPMGTEIRTRPGCLSALGRLVAAAVLLVLPSELAAQSAPSIAVAPTTVGAGGTVTVTITNGPGSPTDWIG